MTLLESHTLPHGPLTTFSDIENAAKRIQGFVHKTPIVTSSLLNHYLGHEIYFKAECLQKIGAFKARGGLNSLRWLEEQGKLPKLVVANSSGNHAQAVSWAARQMNVPATIFMPETVSEIKKQATLAYGAKVVLLKTREEVDQAVMEAAEEEGVYWLPPYNHPQVIAGQGTAAAEALAEVEVDAVFAPCGGGGLLSGSLIATRALQPNAAVIGVEPLAANDAAESLRTGKIQRLSGTPNTLADGAKTPSVGEYSFPWLQQTDAFYEVDEAAIIYWSQWLQHLLKLHIEPTSCMSMEAVVQWLRSADQAKQRKQKVLVILSGGNIDQNTMAKLWAESQLSVLPSL